MNVARLPRTAAVLGGGAVGVNAAVPWSAPAVVPAPGASKVVKPDAALLAISVLGAPPDSSIVIAANPKTGSFARVGANDRNSTRMSFNGIASGESSSIVRSSHRQLPREPRQTTSLQSEAGARQKQTETLSSSRLSSDVSVNLGKLLYHEFARAGRTPGP